MLFWWTGTRRDHTWKNTQSDSGSTRVKLCVDLDGWLDKGWKMRFGQVKKRCREKKTTHTSLLLWSMSSVKLEHSRKHVDIWCEESHRAYSAKGYYRQRLHVLRQVEWEGGGQLCVVTCWLNSLKGDLMDRKAQVEVTHLRWEWNKVFTADWLKDKFTDRFTPTLTHIRTHTHTHTHTHICNSTDTHTLRKTTFNHIRVKKTTSKCKQNVKVIEENFEI